MTELPLNKVLCGDSSELIPGLPESSIDLVVTSPPYWRLRDYGHPGQIGVEDHPQKYVEDIQSVCEAIKRVLKPEGSLWLNLGDTYHGSGNTRGRGSWLQPKQLLGIPWRVAMALQEDGWILRNCIIWYKSNHLPSSVKDRLTRSYEFIFFLVKNRRYYFNLDEIREPHKTVTLQGAVNGSPVVSGSERGYTKHETATNRTGSFSYRDPLHIKAYHPKGKNPGDMWTVPTRPFRGAHFSVYPPALVEPIIKAGCPRGGVVLDPFAGSGTTLRVARRLGRCFVGIEINPKYAEMCRRSVREGDFKLHPGNVAPLTEAFSDHIENRLGEG